MLAAEISTVRSDCRFVSFANGTNELVHCVSLRLKLSSNMEGFIVSCFATLLGLTQLQIKQLDVCGKSCVIYNGEQIRFVSEDGIVKLKFQKQMLQLTRPPASKQQLN